MLEPRGERQVDWARGLIMALQPDADVANQVRTDHQVVAPAAGQGKVCQRPRVCQAAENLAHDVIGETIHVET